MQKHEKLKTIYEVMAPHIVRNERNWRDYLTYASNFFKVYPFDNVLLAYGQNPNATVLATFDDWKKAKRDIIKDSKGIAVCEYENARLTVKTLFDVSQTRGPELQKTNWQLDSYIRQALTDRLAYAHGLNVTEFNMMLRALAAEAVNENYQTYFHGLSDEISGHLFENVPNGGLETQITDLLTDSVTWFISKRCGLSDDEIPIGDGMVTVSHFNTLPLITRLGHAVTLISRGILLEAERTIKIVNKERVENNERTVSEPGLHGERRVAVPESANLQRQRGRSAPRTVRQDGAGIPANGTPAAVYDFENGWQSDVGHAQGSGRSLRENRELNTADAPKSADAGHRGHSGENPPLEPPAVGGRGNDSERLRPDTAISEIEKEPQGSFSMLEIWFTPNKNIPYREGDVVRSLFTSAQIVKITNQSVQYLIPEETEQGPYEMERDRFEENLENGVYRTITSGDTVLNIGPKDTPVVTEQSQTTAQIAAEPSDASTISTADKPAPVAERTGSPLWEQYKALDDFYSDSIVFMQLGDFYEVMGDKAKIVAGELNLTLKGRDVGLTERIPLVDFRSHSLDKYSDFLLGRNYNIITIHANGEVTERRSPETENGLSDNQIRWGYEHILTSVDMYPAALYIAIRNRMEMDDDFTAKGADIAEIYKAFGGGAELRDDMLYRTVLRGDDGNDGMSFYIGDSGYTYLPWSTIAGIIDALIKDRDYPDPRILRTIVEKETEFDDYAIPDEPASYNRNGSETEQLSLYTPGEQMQLSISEVKPEPRPKVPNDAPHRNYRAFNRLFPQIIDGTYSYLRLESEGFEPLSVERLTGNQYSIMHTFVQNGDLMRDPDMVIEIDHDNQTIQALSYELSSMGVYQEVYAGNNPNVRLQKELNSFFSTWIKNIGDQDFAPVRAVSYVNGEDISVTFGNQGNPVSQLEQESSGDQAEIRILSESLDAHNGQVDMLMQAVQDTLTVGVVLYSIFEDTPYINNITVLEEFQRQGIATTMLQQLQVQFPGKEIDWGELTEDGAALYEAITRTEPNERYHIVKDNIEGLTDEIKKYESLFDQGMILSDKQSADWDECVGLRDDYEKELETLRPVKRFIRLPSDPAPVHDEIVSEQADSEQPHYTPEPKPRFYSDNFRYSDSYNLYPGGAKTKYKNNIEAIRLLKRIESERRSATAEEQVTLARYVGWGGIANAFSDKAKGWEKEYQELRLILNDQEYRQAFNSTLTAYYTEPELVRHIYSELLRFGFKGGTDRKILDPAMGTGNFFSVLPDELAGTKLYGVELDGITGRIAKLLYPNAEIAVKGYESTHYENASFDVILGNIPFNDIKVVDKRYKEHEGWRIHDYFFGRSLDLLKPGGIIAFITSQATLDKTNDSVRRYIAERAEFIGAVRLPNNAFKELAGTEVTADIIFLKKREQPVELATDDLPDWIFIQTDRKRNYIRYNSYFQENPDMALGDMVASKRMYGNEDGTACIAPDEQDLYTELDRALGLLHASISSEPDLPVDEAVEDEERVRYEKAPDGTKNYTYFVRDDKIFYCEHNHLTPQNITGKKAERIKGLCEIREALLSVIRIQSHDYYDPLDLSEAQAVLNNVYDAFVAKNGAINSKGNILAFSDDDQFLLLRSIEDERKDKSGWDKSQVFYKATIQTAKNPTRADTSEEALQISMSLRMKVDLVYMQYLTGKRPDTMIEELGAKIYLNPHKYHGNIYEGWEIAEEYLSGNVGGKLLYARQRANDNPELFSRNVQALEAVLPEWLGPGDIHVQISTPWIPLDVYRQFMYETLETERYHQYIGEESDSIIEIHRSEYSSHWFISGKWLEKESVTVNKVYGTERINAYEIFEDTLNLQTVTIRDAVEYTDELGKKQTKYVVNADDTIEAREKQSNLKEAFVSWIWKDKNRRDALVKLYNETFNTVVPRVYDGSHLIFQNMSEEEELRPHQKDFAARVIYSGTGLAAHVVGAGKTASMLSAGMYLKQLGAIKKPVYDVPNPLVSQWAREFYRFYPNANLLVTTLNDFTKQNRNRFVSKIAMNEYDGIIIAHSQFERIPISSERQIAMLQNEISQLSFEIEMLKAKKGENWTVKQMARFQNNLEARLTRLSAEEKKDDLLSFEQLGIDMMFVDEAHIFKNCFVYTKLRNIAGIGTASSQRAFDMLLKCQYLQEINDGRGVVFATGTPVSNSISELFVMQRYLQPQELSRMRLTLFDNWVAQFGEVVNSLEITPEGGGYRMRQRIARFHNLPELMKIFHQVADIKTADMLDCLSIPEIEGGKPAVIAVEPTPYQQAMMESYIKRADDIRLRKVKPEDDNMLKLTNEARLLAIDPRLVYGDAPADPDTKLGVCANYAYDIWLESLENRSAMIIFSDSGTPKTFKFDAYNEIKRLLIEKGVPEDEIAFVHDATTDAKRDAMYEKVRRGEIRIILGSTSKLGTGTNIQDKMLAALDLDCPWKPSEIEQRHGRVVRPGNENPVVKILVFVTRGTFDAYLWQIQEQKLKYIMQIMTGKSIARSCEDVDEKVLTAAEFKAVATNNPILLEKMEVDNEVGRLRLLYQRWQNEQASLERNVDEYYPNNISRLERTIPQIQADLDTVTHSASTAFQITIDGVTFDERAKAGERLAALIKSFDWMTAANDSKGNLIVSVGEYRGLELCVTKNVWNSLNFVLKGQRDYSGDLGDSELGAITRIENEAERIHKYLGEAKKELENYHNQLEKAKALIGQPFEHVERLAEFAARQVSVNAQIEFMELHKDDDLFVNDEAQSNGNEVEQEDEQEDEQDINDPYSAYIPASVQG